jgi:hypothetical protein
VTAQTPQPKKVSAVLYVYPINHEIPSWFFISKHNCLQFAELLRSRNINLARLYGYCFAAQLVRILLYDIFLEKVEKNVIALSVHTLEKGNMLCSVYVL